MQVEMVASHCFDQLGLSSFPRRGAFKEYLPMVNTRFVLFERSMTRKRIGGLEQPKQTAAESVGPISWIRVNWITLVLSLSLQGCEASRLINSPHLSASNQQFAISTFCLPEDLVAALETKQRQRPFPISFQACNSTTSSTFIIHCPREATSNVFVPMHLSIWLSFSNISSWKCANWPPMRPATRKPSSSCVPSS